MTLTATATRATYPGTGSTGPFAFPFKILSESDLLVTKRVLATGVETVLTWPSGFTVAGVLGLTGSITLTTALAVGEVIFIRRAPPMTQPTSIRNQGTYFPATIEDEFDRLVMQMQSLQDQVSRAPKLSETYDPAGFNMAGVVPAANQVLAFNSTATGIEARAVDTSAGVVLPGNGRTVTSLSSYLANNAVANVLDYGAKFDGVTHPLSGFFANLAAAQVVYPHAIALTDEIDWAATQLVVNRFTRGGIGWFPLGTGLFNRSVAIVVDGITLQGQGGHTGGTTGNKPTSLLFSSLATGLDAITAIGSGGSSMEHTQFKNFFLEMTAPGGQIGGAGIKCFNCSTVAIDGVSMQVWRGQTCFGIQFSLTTTPNAVIVSSIRNCTVSCTGTPFYIGTGCTSILLDQNFALSADGATGGYVFKGSTYCTANVCAADTGTNGAYGFWMDTSTGIVLNGCGAENNAKGFIRIFGGCAGISMNGCRGVGNNVSADATIGSFCEIGTGINYNIKIENCTDTLVNAATTWCIHGVAGNLWTLIIGYNPTSFSKPVGGDATWQTLYVSQIASLGPATFPNILATFVVASGSYTMSSGEFVGGFDASKGNYFKYTADAARLCAAPIIPTVGQRIVITIIQDGVGGRAITWNAVFKKTWADAGNAANTRSSIAFWYDGTNWNQDGAQTPYV